MTTKHTPGPWRVTSANRNGAEVSAIASVAWCGAASSFGKHETQVIDGDEAYANACLVAAAPDLLAACDRLLMSADASWRGRDVGHDWDVACDEAVKAIAKARGQ